MHLQRRLAREGAPTNSTGKTVHLRMTATLGCGVASSALGATCLVCDIHHALVPFSTRPLNGTAASRRSKALCRSVVTMTMQSPQSYVSRTLP